MAMKVNNEASAKVVMLGGFFSGQNMLNNSFVRREIQ